MSLSSSSSLTNEPLLNLPIYSVEEQSLQQRFKLYSFDQDGTCVTAMPVAKPRSLQLLGCKNRSDIRLALQVCVSYSSLTVFLVLLVCFQSFRLIHNFQYYFENENNGGHKDCKVVEDGDALLVSCPSNQG